MYEQLFIVGVCFMKLSFLNDSSHIAKIHILGEYMQFFTTEGNL